MKVGVTGRRTRSQCVPVGNTPSTGNVDDKTECVRVGVKMYHRGRVVSLDRLYGEGVSLGGGSGTDCIVGQKVLNVWIMRGMWCS